MRSLQENSILNLTLYYYCCLFCVERYLNRKVIEVRIPWLLLNFKDPSKKEMMEDISKGNLAVSQTVDGIYVGLSYVNKQGDLIDSFPKVENNQIPKLELYSWPNWDIPQSIYRLKESYFILQKKFTSAD